MHKILWNMNSVNIFCKCHELTLLPFSVIFLVKSLKMHDEQTESTAKKTMAFNVY